MRFFLYILVYAFCIVLPFALQAGLTEEGLEPYKKVLPMKLTPKEIAEWPLEITYKKETLTLKVNSYTLRLNKKDYRKLEKKKKVRLRIAGDVKITKTGKKTKSYYKGAAKIYVITTEDPPKIAGHKKLKLSKLCPS